MIKTPSQLIDAKGGPAVFAKAIKVEPSAARMMKHRNKIPRSAWPEIIEAFPDVSMADLKALEQASSGAEAA
jgi:hypothetical protein